MGAAAGRILPMSAPSPWTCLVVGAYSATAAHPAVQAQPVSDPSPPLPLPPPPAALLAAGAVPVLVEALQPPRMDATAMETVFEAAWAITNLAVARGGEAACALAARTMACRSRLLRTLPSCLALCPMLSPCAHPTSRPCLPQGEFETVKAVLAAAPALIAYLGGGSGLPVAEQCAWALGAWALGALACVLLPSAYTPPAPPSDCLLPAACLPTVLAPAPAARRQHCGRGL